MRCYATAGDKAKAPPSIEEEIFGAPLSDADKAAFDAEAAAWAAELGYQRGLAELPAEEEEKEAAPRPEKSGKAKKGKAAPKQPIFSLEAATEEEAGTSGADEGEDMFGDGKPRLSQRQMRKLGIRPQLWKVPAELLPKVAIVGRPNVGKSALFNRITGTNDAIVHDKPGVTRDRRYTRAYWGEREFMCIDTGGLMVLPGDEAGSTRLSKAERAALAGGAEVLPGMIEQQAAQAVEEADVLMVVADGQAGLVTADEDILTWLRKKYPNKPFVLAINKCESPTKGMLQAAAFYETGVEPLAVSAISSTGVGELLDKLVEVLPPPPGADLLMNANDPEPDRPLRVAIIGRPNVGKSSILNCLAGEVRSIVNDQSGTTTDAIDTEVTDKNGRVYSLIDTAGIRKRAKVHKADDGTEELAVERALRAMKRADVVALVIDALLGATEQDYRIADRATQDGCAMVFVVNKWDTVPDKDGTTMVQYEKNLRVTMRSYPWAPVIFTTATTGQRVQQILDAAGKVGEEHKRRVSTGVLNSVIRDAIAWKNPPMKSGRAGRVYYVTQAGARPPTFVFFVNDPKIFPESYMRYLERSLRENVGFKGTPIKLLMRGKAVVGTKDKNSD